MSQAQQISPTKKAHSKCHVCGVRLIRGENWYVSQSTHKCKACYKDYRLQFDRSPNGMLAVAFRNARARARRYGLLFEIDTWRDLPPIPSHCPVLGLELRNSFNGTQGPCLASPSLDRIIPELGYVLGNVQWLSQKANRFKADKSLEQLKSQPQCTATLATIKYMEENLQYDNPNL